MSWLFETHSLWRDALLSLDAGRRSLVLPQLEMPGFVNSPRKALLSLEWREGRKELGEGKGGIYSHIVSSFFFWRNMVSNCCRKVNYNLIFITITPTLVGNMYPSTLFIWVLDCK